MATATYRPDAAGDADDDGGDVVRRRLVALAREDGASVLALLARRFGDLDLAEDAVQDGLLEAARTWPTDGVPDNPAGWLLAVARRRALDLIRRRVSQSRRALDAAVLARADLGAEAHPAADPQVAALLVTDEATDAAIPDERLRLILLCCHPALDPAAQVPLVLRLVSGLTTAEIAAACLVPEATLAQRIVRAKKKIRDARIPLSIPADLSERLDAVLSVLYLMFNEGYLSRSGGTADSKGGGTDGGTAGLDRPDLARETVRLTGLLTELLPGRPEVEGLLALELFHLSRQRSRTDAEGHLVRLADQDRSRWDADLIRSANTVLATALRRLEPGPYQVQAVIAGYHANAPDVAHTDWRAVAASYRQLVAMTGSSVAAVNLAVAVAEADGPGAGLAVLDDLQGIDGYHLLHATRADLLSRMGRPDEARQAYARALELTDNAEEKYFLRRRLEAGPR